MIPSFCQKGDKSIISTGSICNHLWMLHATLALGWSEFTPSYFGPFQEETRVFEALPDIQIPSMLRGVFQTGYRAPFRAVFDTDLCIHHGVLIYPERGDCL